MTLTDANAIAQTILNEIKPFCHQAEIAGSIRRLKPEVKDIEIVCSPRWESVAAGFFKEDEQRLNSLYCRWGLGNPSVTWIKPGTHQVIKWDIQPDGKYWRGLISNLGVQLCKLDIFLTTPEQFGLILMIRTGSSDFSHRLVTKQSEGGWLPDFLRVQGGFLWHGEEKVPTPTEQSVLDAIGRAWIPPEKRV